MRALRKQFGNTGGIAIEKRREEEYIRGDKNCETFSLFARGAGEYRGADDESRRINLNWLAFAKLWRPGSACIKVFSLARSRRARRERLPVTLRPPWATAYIYARSNYVSLFVLPSLGVVSVSFLVERRSRDVRARVRVLPGRYVHGLIRSYTFPCRRPSE